MLIFDDNISFYALSMKVFIAWILIDDKLYVDYNMHMMYIEACTFHYL